MGPALPMGDVMGVGLRPLPVPSAASKLLVSLTEQVCGRLERDAVSVSHSSRAEDTTSTMCFTTLLCWFICFCNGKYYYVVNKFNIIYKK